MTHSKLKILFCLAVCLTVLFAPFLLEIFPGGETYAMANWFSQDRSNSGSDGQLKAASLGEQEPKAHPTPEPATILLFGAGAAGLAAFRKKFRKK
jgi:hypothetical protein